jgi:hypothetical protein
VKIVHGEQGLILHKPLPTEGEIIGRSRVTGLVDRGEGKGALMYSERQVIDAKTGDLLATLTSTSFLRGDGGFGGPSGPVKQPHAEPDRAPDITLDLATRPEQALIYRLNTDPAWAVHLWHGMPRTAEDALQLRHLALRQDGFALFFACLSR